MTTHHDRRPPGQRPLGGHAEPPLLPPEVADALAGEAPAEQARLVRAWHLAGHLLETEPKEADLQRLGGAIWQHLQAATSKGPHRPPLRLVRLKGLGPLAAACLALAAIGLALWLRPTTVTAPPGQVTSILLPDGSHVELSSRSTLTYPRRFRRPTRSVSLSGEAFFDVAHDEKPFVVATFNAYVTVPGTQFNVRAWPDDQDAATEVALASGTVRLAPVDHPRRVVTLAPGQTSRVATTDTVPTLPLHINLENALAWRSGGFFFDEQPPGAILRELERRYGIEIRAAPELLQERPRTFTYDRPVPAEAILSDLCAAYGPYGFRPIPGGYEVYRTDQP